MSGSHGMARERHRYTRFSIELDRSIQVQANGRTLSARLDCISIGGIAVDLGDDDLVAGTSAATGIGDFAADAEVVWANGHHAGLRFRNPGEGGEVFRRVMDREMLAAWQVAPDRHAR